jgi:mannose-6-phosphate isomerase-like protein (cupin superfamily)
MAKKMQPEIKPKSEVFSLKTPYLSSGRITNLVSKADGLWIHTKINAEGGENGLHCHTQEDHAFIVLEGEGTFFDEEDNETTLKPFQGIMIPKGAYYRYLNTGKGNLMVVRVGGGTKTDAVASRIDPDGKPLHTNSEENKHIEGVPIPGKFFGE